MALLADIATLFASVHRLTEAEKALSRQSAEMRAAHEGFFPTLMGDTIV